MLNLSFSQKTLLAFAALLLISLPVTLHETAQGPLLSSARGQSSEPPSSGAADELVSAAPAAATTGSSSSTPAERPEGTNVDGSNTAPPSESSSSGAAEPPSVTNTGVSAATQSPYTSSLAPAESEATSVDESASLGISEDGTLGLEESPASAVTTPADAYGLSSSAPAQLGFAAESSQEPPSRSTMTVHLVPLKHAAAVDVAKIMRSLAVRANIAVDERTNSLLFQVDGPKLPEELTSLVEQLDRVAPTRTSGRNRRGTSGSVGPTSSSSRNRSDRDSYGFSTTRPRSTSRSARGTSSDKLQQLRQRYAAAEQESLRLAAEHARLTKTQDESDDKAELNKVRGQLERSVHTAFDRRQSLQDAEVAQLRERLQNLESRLETRKELKDRIIARRIQDLLNPDQRWDPEGVAVPPTPVPPTNPIQWVPSPSVSVPTPVRSPFTTRLSRPSNLQSESPFQVQLQLIEMTPQVAAQLKLPRRADETRDPLTRSRTEFAAQLERVWSPSQLRILAEPNLVTTMGRKARLQSAVRGQFGDDESTLSVDVNPTQFEKGRLKFSVNLSFQELMTTDMSEDYVATGRKTHRIQTDLELSPDELVIAGPWESRGTERLVFLVVHAQAVDEQRLVLQGMALPAPAFSFPVPSVPQPAPDGGIYPVLPTKPPSADRWSGKLPSDYLSARQQIISDITQLASELSIDADDEVLQTRLRVSAEEACRHLRVLALEFAGQLQMCESELKAQKASLELAKQELERLTALHKDGVVSTAEVNKAKVSLQTAAAAYERAVNIYSLFQESQEAIADSDEPLKIVARFRQAVEERRERHKVQQNSVFRVDPDQNAQEPEADPDDSVR